MAAVPPRGGTLPHPPLGSVLVVATVFVLALLPTSHLSGGVGVGVRKESSAPPRVFFLTFATSTYIPAAAALVQGARATAVFDILLNWTLADIAPDFVTAHAARFQTQRRGSGYFLWKPWIVQRVLTTMMAPGDVLMYVDAGCEFTGGSPQPWVDLARAHSFLGFRLTHAQSAWTKADAFDALGMDQATWGAQKQILSGIFLLQRTARNEHFVAEWLRLMSIDHLADDSPSVLENHPTFVEHRHDQSLFSLLAYKYGISLLLEDPTWPQEGASILFAARHGKT